MVISEGRDNTVSGSSSFTTNINQGLAAVNSSTSFNLQSPYANSISVSALSPHPPSEVGSCSTVTTNTGGNPTDYSFRLFENGQLLTSTDGDDPSFAEQGYVSDNNYNGVEVGNIQVGHGPTSLPSLPPALPPKKSKSQNSSVQQSICANEEDVEDTKDENNGDYEDDENDHFNTNGETITPDYHKPTRHKGLTAERKQYFERLNQSEKDFGASVDGRIHGNSNPPRKKWEANWV